MSENESTSKNPHYEKASMDLLKNSALGIVTWPFIEGASALIHGGKFWQAAKESVTTKPGIVSTISFGLLTGFITTLISAALGKYKKPTLILHQTTNHCPPAEQLATSASGAASGPAAVATTQPQATPPKVSEPTTTHTTTTVFADREQERRDTAANTTQPAIIS